MNSKIASIFVLFSIISGVMTIMPESFADNSEIIIEPSSGSNSPVTVDVGGKVIFSNTDSADHGYMVLDPNTAAGTFSPTLKPGDSYEWIPVTAGEYQYRCLVHPNDVGTIIVKEVGVDGTSTVDDMISETAKATEETMESAVEATGEAMANTSESVEEIAEETLEDVEEIAEETLEITEDLTSDVSNDLDNSITNDEEGGGCLIATAAYGSELAPQVQFLREIRDNTVMSTSSGAAFMTGFNQLYYSFSPTIADMERENPIFQETVRTFITPLMSSLSLMTLAEDGNEAQVLGLGISVIALNLGLYLAAPAAVGFTISKRFKSKN